MRKNLVIRYVVLMFNDIYFLVVGIGLIKYAIEMFIKIINK